MAESADSLKIDIKSALKLHALQTVTALQDAAEANIKNMKKRDVDALHEQIQRSRLEPWTIETPSSMQIVVDCCEAINLLTDFLSPIDSLKVRTDRIRYAGDILKLIEAANNPRIAGIGDTTPIHAAEHMQEYEKLCRVYNVNPNPLADIVLSSAPSQDISLKHLVDTHKEDLLALVEYIATSLPPGQPNRSQLLSDIAKTRSPKGFAAQI